MPEKNYSSFACHFPERTPENALEQPTFSDPAGFLTVLRASGFAVELGTCWHLNECRLRPGNAVFLVNRGRSGQPLGAKLSGLTGGTGLFCLFAAASFFSQSYSPSPKGQSPETTIKSQLSFYQATWFWASTFSDPQFPYLYSK